MCNWISFVSLVGAFIICVVRLSMIIPGPLPPLTGFALESYKDVAHIWVGGMLWGWLVNRSHQRWTMPELYEPIYRNLFIVMCVVEVAAFLISRR